ncbi:hypothetical protein [EBPR podovirus 2]|nr:hypothetical protein [EBPR podovirus 2]
MTARATPTQARMQRAIRAARAEGARAVVTATGDILFVEPSDLPQSEPAEPPANPFDAWKAKRDASQAQGH